MKVEQLMDKIIGETRQIIGYSWEIEFVTEVKSWAAQTDHTDHKIVYCLPYFEANGMKFLKDCVIHECAHAIMGAPDIQEYWEHQIMGRFYHNGHTYMWEQIAKSLGGSGFPVIGWWFNLPKGYEDNEKNIQTQTRS